MENLLMSLAGCERKLPAASLQRLVSSLPSIPPDSRLHPSSRTDDAAVWRLDAETLLLGSLDFSPPISSDPDFAGRVAAANALSDIYAMGGRPIFALAILGVTSPSQREVETQALLSALSRTCVEAGCMLAGGHTLISEEPLLGLSVTGQVPVADLRLKKGGLPGDLLVLTKPLGTGLLFAAARSGLLSALPEEAVTGMQRLNNEGPVLAALSEVHAMTDITGFGLLGHLVEICRASRVRAILTLGRIPFFPLVGDFSQMDLPHPAATGNWEAVRATVNEIPGAWGRALSDPQINGGLLFSVSPEGVGRAEDVLSRRGLPFAVIGELAPELSGSRMVEVVP